MSLRTRSVIRLPFLFGSSRCIFPNAKVPLNIPSFGTKGWTYACPGSPDTAMLPNEGLFEAWKGSLVRLESLVSHRQLACA